MSADILHFTGVTRIEAKPEDVLEKAKDWGLVKCVIIGVDNDDEMHFGGSFSDLHFINFLLCKAQHEIMTDDEFDGERRV